MISTWVSVIVMLVSLVNGARNEDDIQPCAKVQTSSSVVPLGSPVKATCVIRDDCPLVIGQAVHIEWRLGDRFLPSSPVANESDRVSEVVIPSFNHTRELLKCCVQGSPPQVVAGVEIRAGYPPEAPQNLSCQTNLTTDTLTCSWDPGQLETHLHTKYTVHTEISSRDPKEKHMPPGVHSYTIPRVDFSWFVDMEIYVKAVNELGEATSATIKLEPVTAAKFDPPSIVKVQAVPKKYGCLNLSWALFQRQKWLNDWKLNLEIRLKTADSSEWSEQPILVDRVKPTTRVNQCRLLNGTQYLAQIRVRYQVQSPWSEWSSSQSGVTLESAPTGLLDWWMKVSEDNTQKQRNIHLFWKPSKQFQANGQNVSYVVSVKNLPGGNRKVCSIKGNYCTFQLPRKVKKVYLSAVNAAGKSSPTEVRIYLPKAHTAISDVTVIPHDDRSLLVQWRSLVSSNLTGFVVEWRPLLQNLSFTQFEITDKDQTRLLITGSFEPYKPYGISVYPRFKDGIGLPQTVNAYSRQKAPSMVPKIQIKKVWQSHIEFTWDEIPLDQRNGIIQSYKVFYWDKKGPINVGNAVLGERRVVLKGLNPVSQYEAFMMVSTSGGSLNGSTLHFETESFDVVFVVMIVTVSGVGVSLLIVFMTCFSINKRLKVRFWPAVPDPANSSIKRWSSESTQDSHLPWDNEEPDPMYLSHLSFLDLPVRLGKEDIDPWLSSAEDTSDPGEYICGSPFIPGYSGSNSDSVPYATVIFSGPCSSPTPKDPHVYLRSESTQPLLESEESFSPKCYQNMATDGMSSEQCFFGPCHDDYAPEESVDPGVLWDDFPFLRALSLNDTQND
ncbi:granulocyte colony-stimulating factor receptor-like isoform X1 [Sebastes fasciatus]|uniref:granulocyte colony-stimulating factor receptor-like isoform X1 n=1 Tax=Sebastes fasciatus TaxID=394691 RepID=UPI003D9E503C